MHIYVCIHLYIYILYVSIYMILYVCITFCLVQFYSGRNCAGTVINFLLKKHFNSVGWPVLSNIALTCRKRALTWFPDGSLPAALSNPDHVSFFNQLHWAKQSGDQTLTPFFSLWAVAGSFPPTVRKVPCHSVGGYINIKLDAATDLPVSPGEHPPIHSCGWAIHGTMG